MGRDDWYRRTTWTKTDQEEFFARLKRSRTLYHKSQYVRIQAWYLSEAGLFKDSLELLDLLFAEYAHEFQIASAHDQSASCFVQLGQPKWALESYRAAIQYQREYPHSQTCAATSFALLVAIHEFWDLIDEAVEYLDEYVKDRGIIFPADSYAHNASMAIFAWECGEKEDAKRFAAAALDDSGATYSGLPRHPDVGLATPIPQIQKKLQKILKGSDRKPWWKPWTAKGS